MVRRVTCVLALPRRWQRFGRVPVRRRGAVSSAALLTGLVTSVAQCATSQGESEARGASSPGGLPLPRSASSAACRSTAAAALSTTCRLARSSFPPWRSAPCATAVVKRSSNIRTGIGAIRAASSAANPRASAAARPSRPDKEVGSPTTTSMAPCSAASVTMFATSPWPLRTVVSGVASTPRGSLRATPTRTEPTSIPRRTPTLTE
jgi:hypothetical protein